MSITSSVVSIPKPEMDIPRLLRNISAAEVPSAYRKTHLERALTAALETLFVDTVLRHGDVNPRQKVPEKVLLFAMANISSCLLTRSGVSWQTMADEAWEVFHDHIRRGTVYQHAYEHLGPPQVATPLPVAKPAPPSEPIEKKVEEKAVQRPTLVRPDFDIEAFVKTLPPPHPVTGLLSETSLCVMSIQLCEVFSAAIEEQVGLFKTEKSTVSLPAALSIARQKVTTTLRETKTRSLQELYNTAWDRFVNDFWDSILVVRRRVRSTQKD